MRTLLAGALSSIAAVLIGWAFSERLFHGFKRRTPGTWRNESRMRTAGWFLVNDVVFGFAFAAFFHLVGGIGRFNIDNWMGQGLTFGIGCWAAVALPMCLSILVLMRVHQGVIIGMLLDWLASSIAAGLICAWVLGR